MKTSISAQQVKDFFLKVLYKKSKSGFESVNRIYEYEDCTGCALKDKCTKAKGNKQLQAAKEFLRLRI